jgi:hypothetical protein
MKNLIIGVVIGGILGAIAGFASGLFVYPYLFLADVVAAETLDPAAGGARVASGMFIHANPRDPIHYGRGGVTVYEDVVHLEQDFEVGPGPAFHVYLVPETGITPDTDVAATMFVDLGRLRAFRGSQVYRVPDGVELSDYGSVVIWCEHFGVLISPAELSFE